MTEFGEKSFYSVNDIKSQETLAIKTSVSDLPANAAIHISKELIAKIKNERKKQVLDKQRISMASELIKKIEEGYLKTCTNNPECRVREYYEKYFDVDSLIGGRKDISLVNREYKALYPYEINIADKNNKGLLDVLWGETGLGYTIRDKNGLDMIKMSTVNGIVYDLLVKFNKVEYIPEMVPDKVMWNYAQNAINRAKTDTASQIKIWPDGHSKTIKYYNKTGTEVALEYFPRIRDKGNKEVGILNPKTGDEVIFALNEPLLLFIQKYRGKNNTFEIRFNDEISYRHSEYISLYDEKKAPDLFCGIYWKVNYGLVSHPLTKMFWFRRLSERNIKPWDLTILKHYIR